MSDHTNNNDDWAGELEVAPVNLNKRLPAVLLLDTSGSMSGARIDALNDGLRVLQQEFDPETGDPVALRSVELAMVTFGYNGVQLIDLSTGNGTTSSQAAFVEAIDYRAPVLSPGGGTPMGPAMTLALKALDERRAALKQQNIPLFCPWIFLISDGAPDSGWESAAAAAVQTAKENHVMVFPIGVQGANLDLLGKFSTIPALSLQGLKFRELFRFISDSVTRVSQSAPDAKSVALPTDKLQSWAQIDLSHG